MKAKQMAVLSSNQTLINDHIHLYLYVCVSYTDQQIHTLSQHKPFIYIYVYEQWQFVGN